MARRTGHVVDAVRGASPRVADTCTGSGSTARRAGDETMVDTGGSGLFGDVPVAIRMQMELVARATAAPDEALDAIIELLVDGSPQKRSAVATAIRTNDPLREQWERTWEVLRR